MAPARVPLMDETAFDLANGLWKGKRPPFVEAGVIRNTNFTESGTVDYSDVAWLEVEQKQLASRQLKPGDIIVERSGGGPKQPVGRVVFFERDDAPFSFSSFTSRVRVIDQARFDARFVFYCLLDFYCSGATDSLQRRTTGIRNLDWRAYREQVSVPTWPLDEQRKIAAVLSGVQRAIEQQERLIGLTTELKKALMHKLFTEGTRGEPQKQTEIGPIPQSWSVVTFDEFAVLQRGKDLPKSSFRDGEIPVIGATKAMGTHDTANVRGPGVTVVRSGSSAGKPLFIPSDFWAHNVVLYVKDFRGNDPKFVYYQLMKLDLTRFKAGVAVPTLNRNTFRGIRLAVPDLAEQLAIAHSLDTVHLRTTQAEGARDALSDLFRTLLHQLMTAQIRVHNVDLGALGQLTDVGELQEVA